MKIPTRWLPGRRCFFRWLMSIAWIVATCLQAELPPSPAPTVRLGSPSLIESIPNQVIIEGGPAVRILLSDSDSEGQTRWTGTSTDRGQYVRAAVVGGTGVRLLELLSTSRGLASPVRSLLTVTAVSGQRSNAVQFFVTVLPRDFSPQSPTGTPRGWGPFNIPVRQPNGFAWADVNRDGYPDLTSLGGATLNQNPIPGPGGNVTPLVRGVSPGLQVVAWGDMDGEGTPDVFVGGTGAFGIYRKRRGTTFQSLELVTNQLEALIVQGAAWADLDGNGTLDLVYSGVTNETRRVIVALNDGQGALTMMSNGLPVVAGPVVATDFDRDGRVDLLLCDNTRQEMAARIHFNRGAGSFVPGPVVADDHPVTGAGVIDIDGDGIPDVWLVQAVGGDRRKLRMSVLLQNAGRFTRTFGLDHEEFSTAAEPAWGDMDHDGLIDFVAPYRERLLQLSGKVTFTNYVAVYRNRGGGQFERGSFLFVVPASVDGRNPSFIPAVADVDLDGDLDLVGHEQGFRVFYNQRREPNLPPEAPSGLRGFVVGEELFLFWSATTDPNQTAPLTYNVRVGSSPGANDLVSAHSLPSGIRLLPAAGNAGHLQSQVVRLSRTDLESAYWSVQAVDASFSGGPFAAEQTLKVTFPGNRPPDVSGPSQFTLQEDSNAVLEVTVTDDRTPSAFVTVRVEVDPQPLFSPAPSAQLSRSDPTGSKRLIALSPALNASGVATLTVVATDRNGAETRREIQVLVLPDNDGPGIEADVVPFQFQGRPITGTVTVADLETPVDALTVSAHSSNPELLPEANIRILGTGSERSLVVTPVGLGTGLSAVTLTVTDGQGMSSSTQVTFAWQDQLLEPHTMAAGIPRLDHARWVDMDGDGLLDLLGSERDSSGVVAVWRQEPLGTWSSVSRFVTGFELGQLIPGDFDGDGDVDLMAAARLGATGAQGRTMALLLNDQGRIERSSRILSDQTFPSVVSMDADADGDPDLVAARNGTELMLWRNPGGDLTGETSSAWQPFPLVNPLALGAGIQGESWVEGLLPADVDLDGRMDLILSRTGEPGSARGRILRQNGNGLFVVEVPSWRRDASVLDWADFENDGVPGLLVGYPNDPSGRPYRLVQGDLADLISLVSWSTKGLGDLDGDGFVDVLVQMTDGRGFGLLSGIVRDTPKFTPQPSGLGQYFTWSSGDVDADGRLDLLGTGDNGPAWIRNVGTSSNRPPSVPSDLHFRRVRSGEIELAWAPSTDPEQSGGLSYNVRLGTTPGANDVVSALALPGGAALIPGYGNAGWRRHFLISGLELGRTYYWTVQAVDSGLGRSAFASELSFTATALPEISAIAHLSLPPNAGMQSVAFVVSDRETPSAALQVMIASSNPVLLPPSRISLGGGGSNRVAQLDLKPDRSGRADISIRVIDGEGNVVEQTFSVYVSAPTLHSVVTDLSLEVSEGSEGILVLNGFDPDGDFQNYQISRAPRHGTLEGDGVRRIYRPESGYFGDDDLEFLATTPGSWPAKVRVMVKVVPTYYLRPESRLSYFGIPARLRLVIQGRAGSLLRVEHSRDLVNWDLLREQSMPDNEALSLEPSAADDHSPHFYRAVRPQ